MERTFPVLYREKSECCGCGLCSVVCPAKAISMQLDEEGFFYPDLNLQKCVGCQKCLKNCIWR